MAEPAAGLAAPVSANGDEVRVKTGGKIRDYVSYVTDRLQVRFPDPRLGSANVRAEARATRGSPSDSTRRPLHDPSFLHARTDRHAVRDRRVHLARGHGHRHRARRAEGGRGG